ncbi:MAG: TIR domain-containing protein [Allosphingosinicella sp.]
MAEAGPGEAGGYVAFISYSHKDAAAGRWLHRKLEGYRLPKRLAGTQGEDGEVPARLTPIFRDRDELPAAGDLSERVRAALAASRNLIVLCSPNSAASPWVAKEIATFRELHPGRPIFTAIVEGEPEQCFCPALLEGGAEPLAADLRKEGDGRRLGLLKLVAGLAGVGLDSLVQRDAARRVRQITYITAASVAAMLVMTLLTALALNARADADRQRADAESLVEFMRTDLRDVLRSVGRLDVMTLVNERALRRYSSQDLEGFPDDALERRAGILHAMGEDDIARGNYPVALAAFREAHRTTASLLEKAPNDPKRIFGHGQSEYWVGRIHELRKEWPETARLYGRYGDAAQRLIRIDPNNPDYMLEMAWGASNRGVIRRDGAGDQAGAQRAFEEAIQWFAKAVRVRPREVDRRDLANAYGDLADTFHIRRMWPKALEARLRAYQITRELSEADPENADLVYRLSIAERAVAHESARTGNRTFATPFMLRAYRRTNWLTARDPKNSEWLLFRTKIECDFLNRSLSIEAPPERRLQESLIAAAATLAAQDNPSVAEVRRCIKA